MRRIIALAASAAAAVTVLAVPGAHAAPAECGPKGALAPAAQGIKAIALPAPVGRTFYVDDRGFVGGNGTWIFEETNKVANLQRKAGTGSSAPKPVGDVLADNGSSDICTDMGTATVPDTLYV